MLLTAAGQVGVHEGRENGHWNNVQRYSDEVPGLRWSQGQAWCATFVSWVALRAGCATLFRAPRRARRGRLVPRAPPLPRVSGGGRPGVLRPGGSEHTGVVERYDGTHIYTIEGNTNVNGSSEGDGVYRRVRERKSSRVYGYGYPDYPGGIDSADPSWPPPAPLPHPDGLEPFPGAEWFRTAPRSPVVTAMGRRLVAEGVAVYEEGPGPQWTDADRRSYANFQRKIGYRGGDADGWPGPVSWTKLRVPRT